MSAAQFRQRIDARRFAGREAELAGELPAASLPRVAALLAPGAEGNVLSARLSFWQDEHGLTVVSGRVEGSLSLVCQRCLEPATVALASEFRVALQDEAGQGLVPDDYEALEPDNGEIVPADLVEEEVLLALPMVVMHEDEADCGELIEIEHEFEEDAEGAHPFAALKDLKLD